MNEQENARIVVCKLAIRLNKILISSVCEPYNEQCKRDCLLEKRKTTSIVLQAFIITTEAQKLEMISKVGLVFYVACSPNITEKKKHLERKKYPGHLEKKFLDDQKSNDRPLSFLLMYSL